MVPRYRAWHKIKNCMESVTGIWFDTTGEVDRVITLSGDTLTHYWRCQHVGHDLDNLILMQSTGLKDKTGKLIFEGDVVKHTRTNWYCLGHPSHNTDLVDNSEIYRDEKYPGALRCRTIDLSRKNQPPYSSSGYLSFEDSRADKNLIEVISSIHANPELLTKEQPKGEK